MMPIQTKLTGMIRRSVASAVFDQVVTAVACTSFSLAWIESLRAQPLAYLGVDLGIFVSYTVLSVLIVNRRFPVFMSIAAGRWMDETMRIDATEREREGAVVVGGYITFLAWVASCSTQALFLWSTSRLATLDAIRLAATSLFFGPLAALLVLLELSLATQRSFDLIGKPQNPEAAMPVERLSNLRLERMLKLTIFAWAILPMLAFAAAAQERLPVIQSSLSSVVDSAQWNRLAIEKLGALCLSLAPSGILTVVGAVRASWLAGSLVAGPMRKLARQAGQFRDAGELSNEPIGAKGEVRSVVTAFAHLVTNLLRTQKSMRETSARIEHSGQNLSKISAQFAAGTKEQTQSLHETSSTTEELLRAAGHISENAAGVQGFALETERVAAEGKSSAESFREAVERIGREEASMLSALQRLESRVVQIGQVLETINGLARRSELLALSADLEGARAGETGRNFSRVATEMRRLAENIVDSTADVGGLVEEINKDIRLTGAEAHKASNQMALSGTLSIQILDSLEGSAKAARETADAARTISLSTQQQQTGTDQLAEAMAEVLGNTQQSHYSVEQLTSANERIEQIIRRLKSLTEFLAVS
jgi:methyl-accepting chemotaxis protein